MIENEEVWSVSVQTSGVRMKRASGADGGSHEVTWHTDGRMDGRSAGWRRRPDHAKEARWEQKDVLLISMKLMNEWMNEWMNGILGHNGVEIIL